MIPTKLIIYAVAVLAAVAALWGVYTYVDNQGYQRAAVVYQARIDKTVADLATARANETERQVAINDASKAAEARAIEAMQADNEALTQQLQEQAHAASNDPNAKSGGIGADSMRRVDAIH